MFRAVRKPRLRKVAESGQYTQTPIPRGTKMAFECTVPSLLSGRKKGTDRSVHHRTF
jgi:hypothetical protein